MNVKVLMVLMIIITGLSFGCIDVGPRPIYQTVVHNEPVYTTLYTIELDDDGDGYDAIRINNIYNYEYDYTGNDFWGYSEYKVTLYDADGNYYNTYYEINSIDIIDSYEKITSYHTWTEQVIVGYE